MSTIRQLLSAHIDIWTAAETERRSGRGRASGSAASVYGIKKLRELILELAVRGNLVAQDASDEPVGELLKRIQVEKEKLITEDPIRKKKSFEPISSKEIPFQLPKEWKWVRIGQLGHDWGQKIPDRDFTYIDVSAIDNQRGAISSAELVKPENAPSRARKLVKNGTLIYSTIRPYLSNIAVVEEDFSPEPIASTAFAVVHPFCAMPPRYFLFFLRSPVFVRYVESVQMGIAYPAINDRQFFSGLIPLPPIDEQHRIVAKVDELMALCDQLEAEHSGAANAHERLVRNLLGTLTQSQCAADFNANWQRIAAHFDTLFTTEASIDALKQTLLQLAVTGKLVPQDIKDGSGAALLNQIQRTRTAKRNIVALSEEIDPLREGLLPSSWSWASVDQISADDPSAITDGPFGANLKTEHYVNQPGYRVVRLQNIGHGEFRNEHISYIDKAHFEKLVKHQVRGGDLIVAGLIDTSIRCCAAPKDIGHAIVKADCYRLSVHPLVFPSYVHHYLNSATAHEFAAVHHHGLTLTRIGLGNFRSIPIPLPPFAEQHRIVTKIDELFALCHQLSSRITTAKERQKRLADALINNAVAA